MEVTEFRRSYWAENWHRTIELWEKRSTVVGVALLAVASLGYGAFADDPTMAKIGAAVALAYLAINFLILTPWAMWKDAQEKIVEFDERSRPQLQLVFEPDSPPYLQDLFVSRPRAPKPFNERRYRVGIRNDSSELIRNVRVVLESCEVKHAGKLLPQTPEQPIFIEHALNIMGLDNKHGLVDVAPGDRPTAFADVVSQDIDPTTGVGDWMSPCYASGHFSGLLSRSHFILGLRVEGGGTFSRARFFVGATLEKRRIEMTSYSPD